MADQLTVVNELNVLGQQYIVGYQFTGIEGGFGEGKKAMLVKEIAIIHGKQVKHVINNNFILFKEGVDIVDLLGVVWSTPKLINMDSHNKRLILI